jgi:hypothetical protein
LETATNFLRWKKPSWDDVDLRIRDIHKQQTAHSVNFMKARPAIERLVHIRPLPQSFLTNLQFMFSKQSTLLPKQDEAHEKSDLNTRHDGENDEAEEDDKEDFENHRASRYVRLAQLEAPHAQSQEAENDHYDLVPCELMEMRYENISTT